MKRIFHRVERKKRSTSNFFLNSVYEFESEKKHLCANDKNFQESATLNGLKSNSGFCVLPSRWRRSFNI